MFQSGSLFHEHLDLKWLTFILAFTFSRRDKFIYSNGVRYKVRNINAYLNDGPNILVKSRNKPICDVPTMVYGNKPADGGYLIIEADDYDKFIKQDHDSKRFIRPLLGSREYLHNLKRYCLWLVGVSPAEIKKHPLVCKRVQKCRESRLSSKAEAIRKFAKTPSLFAQVTQPANENYLIVPRVSSERRKYIPIGFLHADTIASDAVQIIPNGTLYHFGILESNIHMVWMSVVAGRLKSDYRYSKDIVYNNFPWPNPTPQQKERIEKSAQAILDAREKYSDSSLADLYDPDFSYLYPELKKAHEANDQNVMAAYGFAPTMEESDIVAELMKMYQKLTEIKQ